MYETRIYEFAPSLYRWEIRCGGLLLRTGTAHSEAEATEAVNHAV